MLRMSPTLKKVAQSTPIWSSQFGSGSSCRCQSGSVALATLSTPTSHPRSSTSRDPFGSEIPGTSFRAHRSGGFGGQTTDDGVGDDDGDFSWGSAANDPCGTRCTSAHDTFRYGKQSSVGIHQRRDSALSQTSGAV